MKARVIAMYLPQYHPIPENDAAWGKGFTEWTNVVQARPLFRGHYQPKIPADLGFYDLRMPEVREAQAEMAKDAGIEGFMYWHYWFGNGRKLLERPFEEVVNSGRPDYPFCIGWANHSWMTKTWKKGSAFQKNPMIMEQLYPGEKDYIEHFKYCLPAFRDKRYIKVNGKLLFTVFAPMDMPDVKDFISTWRALAKEHGLKDFHFVGMMYGKLTKETLFKWGFDAVNDRDTNKSEKEIDGSRYITAFRYQLRKFGIPVKYDFRKLMKSFYRHQDNDSRVYPTILAGYDRTARAGSDTVIYTNYNPNTFKEHAQDIVNSVKSKPEEERIIFLKSWNEWGEGNYMEPDLKYGHGFLDALKEVIK